MRTIRASALFTLALVLPTAGVPFDAHAATARAGCAPAGYSHTGSGCIVVPARGAFSMTIAGTNSRISGKGSSRTAGTQITVTKVPPPVRSRGGFGLRVRATGKFNPLKVTPGRLFAYIASKNSLKTIGAIRTSGLYQVLR